MQRIRNFFTTHMAARLWLFTVVPIVVVTLCTILLTGVLFDGFLRQRSVQEAAAETGDTAGQFSRSYRDIISRVTLKLATTEFRTEAQAMAACTPNRYTEINNDAQGVLLELQQMSNILQTAFVVKTGRTDGEPLVFASYRYTLRDRDAALGYDLSAVEGITMLPVTQSPMRNRSEAIPLVVPLHFVARAGMDTMLLVCDDPGDADLILYLFLDAEAVAEYLDIYCNDASQGTLYLADENGVNVSLPAAKTEGTRIEDDTLRQTLAEAAAAGQTTLRYKGYYVYLSPIHYCGLYLVNLISVDQFNGRSAAAQQLLIIIGLSSVAAVTLLCLVISLYTTRPLRSLMQAVGQIRDGSYDGRLRLTVPDEFGQLENAVNEMYGTIQAQIAAIEHEEQEKFDAKMQLLTEQINPHFLYNTLEFINMEVLNGNPENASRMISALGNYTRISLAYGDNVHLIAREIDQVRAYIDIMSCRFDRPVDLLINVPETLRRCEIVKCVLQPLVENSLKYGFFMTTGGTCPIAPRLEITMETAGDDLVISVVDNGAGIDIPRAEKILHDGYGPGADRHIGLHNIYNRLTAYYGRADFSFSTLPYYENRVEIRLPAARFAEPPQPGPEPAKEIAG